MGLTQTNERGTFNKKHTSFTKCAILQHPTSTTKRRGEVKINEANFLRKVCLGKRIRKHEKHECYEWIFFMLHE